MDSGGPGPVNPGPIRPIPVAAARVLGAAGVNAGQPATASLSLPGVCGLTIAEAGRFFEQLELDPTAQQIAQEALKEIRGRLGFLLLLPCCALGQLVWATSFRRTLIPHRRPR